MPTYKEYQQQIAELQELAKKAQAEELKDAKEKVAQLMREHGLTAQDIMGAKPTSVRKHPPSTLLYRDPVSGKTWTGRGRAPAWMDGKNRDEFLVQQ